MIVPERYRRDHGPSTVFRRRFPAGVVVEVRLVLVVVVPLEPGQKTALASRSVRCTRAYILGQKDFLVQLSPSGFLLDRFAPLAPELDHFAPLAPAVSPALVAILTSIFGSDPILLVLVLTHPLVQ